MVYLEREAYELAIAVACSLNEYIPPSKFHEGNGRHTGPLPEAGERPGDDFNERASWDDVLGARGWTRIGGDGGKVYWRRPGKQGPGWSATTGFCSSDRRGDLLYVFSTSAAPFEAGQAYSKFEALTLLDYAGDFSAAAKALLSKGWGNPTAPCGRIVFKESAAAPDEAQAVELPFPRPIPASLLRNADLNTQWLWKGYLARGSMTLLSALWKAGKTTLISHLLKAMESEGTFCGLPVQAAPVLYVTEEHESLWAERRDRIGLSDNVHFLVRPFSSRPRRERWLEFVAYVRELRMERPYSLLVFDPISNLWPVKDENDAPQVQEALMPLHSIGDDLAILLIHHLRKGDGQEATAARGSGALSAFADTLLELRRYAAGDRKDRRRVLTGYGRYADTVDELVVEWTGTDYLTHGDRSSTNRGDLQQTICDVLPVSPPGYTAAAVRENWPEDKSRPSEHDLRRALHSGAEAYLWCEEGQGKRGSPFTYWRDPHTSGPPRLVYPYAEEED